ncbi:MAG: hypothetical protein ACFB5Z_11435 [Elainellaceae cyanobacterium]
MRRFDENEYEDLGYQICYQCEEAIMALAQERKQVLDGETAIALLLRQREGGEMEVALPIGRADLVTNTHVIEIKHVSKWSDAFKVIAYASYFPNLKPRIHLFGMYAEETRQQIEGTMQRLGIEVTFENALFEKIAATPTGERVED